MNRGSVKEKYVVLLLFLFSLPFFFAGIGSGLNVYDEGLSVYGATRILNGEFPYRDFWTIYAPGQFYALAFLFALFGPFLIVERVFTGIIHLSIPICTYLLSKKMVSWRLALLAWGLSLLWMGAFGFWGYPATVAVLLSLLSSLFLTRFFSIKEKRHLWLGGIFTGIIALFRHDLGFYAFLSGTALLVPFIYKNIVKTAKDQRGKILETFRVYTRYLMGVLLVILPVSLFYLYHVPIGVIFSDLILFPIKIFPQFRSLPYPCPISNPLSVIRGEQTLIDFIVEGLGRFPFYFPIVVFFVTALVLVFGLSRKEDFDSGAWSRGLFLLLGITFFSQARIRSDMAHLLPTMIFAILLLPPFLSKDRHQNPFGYHLGVRRTFYVVAVLALLSFGYVSLSPPSQNLFTSLSSTHFIRLNLHRARGILMEPASSKDLEGAVKFVQKCVPEKEKIFVGLPRHDRIFANDVLFYFLSERDSATRYHELHPGVVTTPAVQKEIIGDLIRHQVRYIVLWNHPENMVEPNKSSESSGVTDLDDFIRRHYVTVANFGSYSILKKRGSL